MLHLRVVLVNALGRHTMGQDRPKCKETLSLHKVNVIDFEFFGFNVSIWVPWSPLGVPLEYP